MSRRFVVESDGGSRGNPGPAAYGALVRDPDTGQVLAQEARYLGVVSNNVAEYTGLIAGLRLAVGLDPDCWVDVRMDSKLVVEQMSGRWKIKHDDMRRLAVEARGVLDPTRVTYTWMPRSQNKDADRLANEAMDDAAQGKPWRGAPSAPASIGDDSEQSGTAALPGGAAATEQPELLGFAAEPAGVMEPAPAEGATGRFWAPPDTGDPTEIVLVRHGETPLTAERRFSGAGGSDPELTAQGRSQAAAVARLLAGMPPFAAVVSSPLRRARQTADLVAQALGLPVREDEGWTECAFGRWDGLTTAEVVERWPSEHAAWMASPSVAPPGGESFDDVGRRIAVARDRLLARYPARRVLVVTHVTPIKQLVRLAVSGGSELLWRLQSDAASITVTRWWSDGGGSLASFNETSHLRP